MKTRTIVNGAIAILTLMAVSIAVGGNYLVHVALTPEEALAEKNLASYTDEFEKYPFLTTWMDSLRERQAMKDTFITNDNGIRLHAFYLKAAQPTPRTAVIVHGYTDNAIRMLHIAHLYNRTLGFNVLMPELQHHGHSQGAAIQMGWLDRLDLLQWMDTANEIFGDSTRMIVHGLSMGAATVMMASGEKPVPYYVRGYVEDCGYTDVWSEFSYQLKSMYGLPAFPLLHAANLWCKNRYKWSFREASAVQQVAQCHLPMLFIHGDSDTYVPTSMVYTLYEAKPEPKELWMVPGAEHAEAFLKNPHAYTERIRNFVTDITATP